MNSVSQESKSVSEPGRTVAAERLLQREVGGGRAEPRVAVQVRRADPAADDQPDRVVVLQEQLAAGVEAHAQRPVGVEYLTRPLDHQIHRLVPGGRFKPPVPAYQRFGQTVRGRVGLPAEQALRAEPAMIDAVGGPASDPDDVSILDGDIHATVHRAQHTGRLHPGDVGLGDDRR
jgi:hypothetical protein